MSESQPKSPAAPVLAGGERVDADEELLRLAGIDAERFAALSDFEKRLTLKMAERLVDAAAQGRPPE